MLVLCRSVYFRLSHVSTDYVILGQVGQFSSRDFRLCQVRTE
jgi:dTDP-4-dehydrorhamnose reductase